MNFDKEYYLKFGHHNDNIGTVTRNISLFRSSKDVLIVPCGYGQIVNWCLANGINCHGIDKSEYLISIAQDFLKPYLSVGDIRDMSTDNKYDLVVCCDLLEHFSEEDIKISLINLKKLLCYDGKLLLRVGTDECEAFDSDPTHKTKKSNSWWLDFIIKIGFDLYHGPTDIGEYVFSTKGSDSELDFILYSSDIIKMSHKIERFDKILNLNKDIIMTDNKNNVINIFRRSDNKFQLNYNDIACISNTQSDFINVLFGENSIYFSDSCGNQLLKNKCDLIYPIESPVRVTTINDIVREKIIFTNKILLECCIKILNLQFGSIMKIVDDDDNIIFSLDIKDDMQIYSSFYFDKKTFNSIRIGSLSESLLKLDIMLDFNNCAVIAYNDNEFLIEPPVGYYCEEKSSYLKNLDLIFGKSEVFNDNIMKRNFLIDYTIQSDYAKEI